jgi:hypothetical protein
MKYFWQRGILNAETAFEGSNRWSKKYGRAFFDLKKAFEGFNSILKESQMVF